MNRRETRKEWSVHIRHLKRMYRIEEHKAKANNKVSGRFMNRVVICMILAALIYTVVVLILFTRVGSEPSTLTENVFQFLSVEGGAMALIKIGKTATRAKTDKKHENEPERNEEVKG